MLEEAWSKAWDPVIALVGQDLSSGEVREGVDRVEAGAIRRYLEPLEFDCPLHLDAEVARAYGYGDIIAPYTSLATFAMSAFWSPGQTAFVSAERDAQPATSNVKPAFPPGTPPVTGYFATDMEIEYVRPVQVGERLSRRGNRLVSCEPKETKVGRGAFIKTESGICDEQGDVIARIYLGLYLYNPHERTPL
jgi:hypothetical protein